MTKPKRRLSRGARHAAVAIGAVAVVWLASALLMRRLAVSALPELPDLHGRPAALVDHLRDADRAARRAPNSGEVIGRLGMAYQADTFTDQALQCYGRARQLAPRDWRWHYYAALLREAYGDNASVVQHLGAVVDLNPSFALAWLRLGQAQFKQHDFPAAEAALRQAVSHDREADGDRESGDRSFAVSIYAACELARVSLERGRPDEARTILAAATGHRPDFGPGQRLLSRVETQLGNPAAAEQARARADSLPPYIPPPDPLVDALARESTSVSFLMKQVDLAKRSGRTSWARELCRRAATVDDRDPEAQAMLGVLLLEDGQLAEAIVALEAALQLRPDDHQSRNNLGLALLSLGRVPEAIEHFQAALRDGEPRANALSNLGRALLETGRTEEAIQHLRRALASKPSFGMAHYNLALAFERQGQLPAAIQHLEQSLQLQPNHAESRFHLAAARLQQGRVTDAIPHLAETVRLRPENLEARGQLAQALQRIGRLQEAAAHYEQFLAVRPDVSGALNSLAWLRATAADPALRDGIAAVRLAERAVTLSGRAPAELDTLAAAYAEAGRWPEAVATAEQALALARAANDLPLAAALDSRLARYRAGRPWRESSP